MMPSQRQRHNDAMQSIERYKQKRKTAAALHPAVTLRCRLSQISLDSNNDEYGIDLTARCKEF